MASRAQTHPTLFSDAAYRGNPRATLSDRSESLPSLPSPGVTAQGVNGRRKFSTTVMQRFVATKKTVERRRGGERLSDSSKTQVFSGQYVSYWFHSVKYL